MLAGTGVRERKTLQELTENTVPRDFKLFEKLPEIDLSNEGIQGQLVKKIIRKGASSRMPVAGEFVTVHYVAYFTNGVKFKSSKGQKPYTFMLGHGKVMKGWDIGIATMKVGERALIMCGPGYAYGAQASGLAPANCALIFDIELLSVAIDRSRLYKGIASLLVVVLVVVIANVL